MVLEKAHTTAAAHGCLELRHLSLQLPLLSVEYIIGVAFEEDSAPKARRAEREMTSLVIRAGPEYCGYLLPTFPEPPSARAPSGQSW
jgi:hypothetical protein